MLHFCGLEPLAAATAVSWAAARRDDAGLAEVCESAAVLEHGAYALELARAAEELVLVRDAGVHLPTLVALLAERLQQLLLTEVVEELHAAVDAVASDILSP